MKIYHVLAIDSFKILVQKNWVKILPINLHISHFKIQNNLCKVKQIIFEQIKYRLINFQEDLLNNYQ